MATMESVPQDRCVPYSVDVLAVPAFLEKCVVSVSITNYLYSAHAYADQNSLNVINSLTDTITTCGGTVTLNNTYWQSPTTGVKAPSTCALTVRMDTKLVEQLAKPICQIR